MQTNTFQVVIASDGRDSFVAFLYPEDGLTWLRGDGKTVPVKVDVPGQAGFDAGDNSRYYRLPGSGNPEVLQLSEYVRVFVDFFPVTLSIFSVAFFIDNSSPMDMFACPWHIRSP
jgi:hypothetical protein